MGFVEQRHVYKLEPKDPAFTGLEVSAHELTTRELWAFTAAQKAANGPDPVAAEQARMTVMQTLADALVSWNVEDPDGTPVPMTVDGLLGRGHSFNAHLMDVWTDALAGISAPLSPTSSGGQPSLEASIPMETSSESLAS